MSFFVVPANTAALSSNIGPSEWQPGGRRTFVPMFFNHLFQHSMGSIQMQYTILNAIFSLFKPINYRPFKQIINITLNSLK